MANNQDYYAHVLFELDVYAGNLTKWEVDFIESMYEKIDADDGYKFSQKEIAVIDNMKGQYLQ